MFRFFSINDPYRLIAIFLIAFAIKMPFILSAHTYYEMNHWLVIGEAMQSNHMYRQIFDSLAPLAASSYWIIVAIFGKSALTLNILGTLLMIVQAVIFNNLALNNKIYEKPSYLPAFIFLILSSSHFGLSVLSPVQMGMTFILLAFGKLLMHVEFRAKRDEQIMSIGLLIGVAILFYLPFLLSLVIVLIILIVFTNTLKRRYVILVVSALIPLIIAFAYYWLVNGEAGYFIVNFVQPSLATDFSQLGNIWQNIDLFFPVLLLWLLGLITMPKQRRLNNYQIRLSQLFLLTGLLSILILVFKETEILIGILLLVPVASYFAGHLFFLIKRPLTDFVISLLFVAVVLLINYDSEYRFLDWTSNIETEIIVDSELIPIIENKKIMVLGDQQHLYAHGSLATPFYNWSLAKPIIDNLDYYDNLVFIKESVDRYQPEVVLDYELKWTNMLNNIPELRSQYKQIRPLVWVRK